MEDDLLAVWTSPAPSALPTCTLAAMPSPSGICNHSAGARCASARWGHRSDSGMTARHRIQDLIWWDKG